MDVVLDPMRPDLRLGRTPIPVVGRARVYVCGITPYAVTHLGHAATYLWTDLTARVWRAAGVQVELARNITDVDDAMFAEARRLGMPFDQVAAMQRFSFDRSMSALGIQPPDHEPTARAAVTRVIELTTALLRAGHAYERNGTVYARTAEAADRAGLDRAAAIALAAEFNDDPRDPNRDDPLDVAVWRADPADGEFPSWPSPWGPGRPGWHAECAAMVLSTFGSSIDLHVGGADLRFPHHAVESLLAEQATGVRPFARAWLHPGTVRVGGVKMSKSLGNLAFVDDLLTRHTPSALRLLCLGRAWDADWDFDESAFGAAEAALDALYAAAARPGGGGGGERESPAAAEVDAALLDNLDTVRAQAVALEAGGDAARRFISVLGLI
nr:cysteine--tRNA ligase [Frankia sp. CcI49]